MKLTTNLVAATAAGIIVLTIAGAAVATGSGTVSDSEQAENQAFMTAKVSLADAVKAAEERTGGKAIEAEISNENGMLIYQLETLLPNGQEHDVTVDAMDVSLVTVMTGTDHEAQGEDCENDEENDEDEADGE